MVTSDVEDKKKVHDIDNLQLCCLKVLVSRILMEGNKAVGVEFKQGGKVHLVAIAIYS